MFKFTQIMNNQESKEMLQGVRVRSRKNWRGEFRALYANKQLK